ncbi:MAG: FkbM family methyltransferase [Ilumatobacter sp.]|nr:FkbM family methyltransferase [Ilumatobacter sp.]
MQRALRRTGIAGFEATTMAAFLVALHGVGASRTVFDVGANVGLYASTAKKLFPDAQVTAFEPTPKTAEICAAIARRNRLDVRVERCALGSTVGHGTLFLSGTSDSSNSLVEGFKEAVGTVEVAVSTVDAFVAETGIVPNVIKVDAEGYEAEILRGAQHTLQRHRPILILEVLFRRGTDHGPEIAVALDGLDYSGFRIGATTDWSSPSSIAGDPTGLDRDWLLSPTPLDEAFARRFDRRLAEVELCTADRNRRAPRLEDDDGNSQPPDELRRSVAARAERALVGLRSLAGRGRAAVESRRP